MKGIVFVRRPAFELIQPGKRFIAHATANAVNSFGGKRNKPAGVYYSRCLFYRRRVNIAGIKFDYLRFHEGQNTLKPARSQENCLRIVSAELSGNYRRSAAESM
jgi:hypothetical protein